MRFLCVIYLLKSLIESAYIQIEQRKCRQNVNSICVQTLYIVSTCKQTVPDIQDTTTNIYIQQALVFPVLYHRKYITWKSEIV